MNTQEYHKQYYQDNKDKYRAYKKIWKKNNPDKIQQQNLRRRDRHDKTFHKNKTLKKMYGISLEEYNEMLKKQNNVCAICKSSETKIDYRTKQVKALSVDHNHETGKLRGLLCHSCNIALGHFKDSEKLMMTAIEYLETNK